MRLSNALKSVMIAPAAASAPEDSSALLSIPRDLGLILRRHRRTSLLIFVATLSLVVLAIVLAPRTYQSESKLFVRVGRESVTLDPTATTGQTISVYESRENEINSVIDVLQSRVILETIADRIGPALAADPNQPAPPEGSQNAAPLSPLAKDAVVRALQQSIEVSNGKKSSVITLTSKAESPELAQRILQEMLDAFRVQHLRINRTAGSYEFFENQRQVLKARLDGALADLRDAKNRYGLLSVEGQRKNLEDQINGLDTAVMQTERALAAANAQVGALVLLRDRLPPHVMTQEVTGFFNDARDRTQERLHQLKIEQKQLLTRYTMRHSKVRTVQQQIDAAQAILQQQPSPNAQQVQATNPAHQQVELQRLTELSRIEALQAEQAALGVQRKQLERDLSTLNQNEILLGNLQHRVAHLQTSYQGYGEKLEQARIDQELEDESISNVNVVQHATFLPQPVSPKKRLIFITGFFLAFASAIGYGFVRELYEGNLKLFNAGSPNRIPSFIVNR